MSSPWGSALSLGQRQSQVRCSKKTATACGPVSPFAFPGRGERVGRDVARSSSRLAPEKVADVASRLRLLLTVFSACSYLCLTMTLSPASMGMWLSVGFSMWFSMWFRMWFLIWFPMWVRRGIG